MDNTDALLKQAAALHMRGQFEAARAQYLHLLQLNPRHVRALHCMGILAIQTRQPDLALELLEKALRIDSTIAPLHASHGDALCELQRFETAISSYDTAIALNPNDPNAHCNRGNALRQAGQHEAAVASYDKALALAPANAAAWNNRGISLLELERHTQAVTSFEAAVARDPNFTAAHYNWANVLLESKDYAAAIAKYDKVVALDPSYIDAYLNRAGAHIKLDRYQAAITSLDQALALNSRHPGAYINRGIALFGLKHYDAAIASYDRAIGLQPDSDAAHFNRGNASVELRQFESAMTSYDQAMALGCNSEGLPGLRLHAAMQLCMWTDFDQQVARLTAGIEAAEPLCQPFHFFPVSESASLQLRAARIWLHEAGQVTSDSPPTPRRDKPQKIRIGYFSPDFCNHPVSLLTAGLFEAHDRTRFEVTAFSLGPDTHDPIRMRLQKAFDEFHDVSGRSDQDIAQLARQLQIDIAVDMCGFTKNSRTKLFAMRLAPLQVSYLGYPGTLGAGYMDYLIADSAIVPPDSRPHYSEKILYLPSYQPNDSKRPAADLELTRAELGLPQSAFVFCCFSTSYKITPRAFGCWMRILERVPQSVLWLRSDNRTAMANLRQEARSRNISPDRLIFAPSMPSMARHLSRYRNADLFLDTWPYGAHTTASDALWAGLPVLTCAGETFASRVAASLLTSIGVPELITANPERYADAAIELACDPPRLAGLRQRLAAGRLTSPLFDTELYTRNLESAYAAIFDRYHAGLPPDHLECASR